MSIFIILRLVQCTCFALYVLWNKWSTVTDESFYFRTSLQETHFCFFTCINIPFCLKRLLVMECVTV